MTTQNQRSYLRAIGQLIRQHPNKVIAIANKYDNSINSTISSGDLVYNVLWMISENNDFRNDIANLLLPYGAFQNANGYSNLDPATVTVVSDLLGNLIGGVGETKLSEAEKTTAITNQTNQILASMREQDKLAQSGENIKTYAIVGISAIAIIITGILIIKNI